MNTIGVILIITLMLQNLIKAVHGNYLFEARKKVHPSIINIPHMALGVNKGLLKQSNAFV